MEAGNFRDHPRTVEEFGVESPTGPEPREPFAVVTVEPSDVVADIHHQKAAVLSPEADRERLCSDTELAQVLLAPASGDEMRAYRVSARVNDPANDDPTLVEPV